MGGVDEGIAEVERGHGVCNTDGPWEVLVKVYLMKFISYILKDEIVFLALQTYEILSF